MLASDNELLSRHLYGDDKSAFEELVRRHSALVMNVCRTMLLNREDSEDAFQATFFVLSRKAASLVKRNSIAGWLYHVAIRNCLEARRLHGRKSTEVLTTDPVDSENEPWLTIAQAQDCELIHREIDKLPKHYRDAILVCHVQGHSREAAAELLNKSETSIKAALARGRNLLRQRLIRQGVMTTALLATIQANIASANAAVTETLVQSTLQTCTASSSSSVAVPSSIQSIAQNGVSMSSSLFAKSILFAAGISLICLPLLVLAQSNQNAIQKIEISGDSLTKTDPDTTEMAVDEKPGDSPTKTDPVTTEIIADEKPIKKIQKITDARQFEISQSEEYWELILHSHKANLQNINQKLQPRNIEEYKSRKDNRYEVLAQSYDIKAKILEAKLNIKRIQYEKKSGSSIDPRRIPAASTSALRPGEVLELKSMTDPSLNDSRVVVQADHTISVALIGNIDVKDLSPEKLRLVLNDQYLKFVKAPEFLVRRLSTFDAELGRNDDR